jgi:sporulation-control protein spo0M
MSFFDKVKAAAGMDTASLQVDIKERPSKRGDNLVALIRVVGGKQAQKMRYLRVSLEYQGKWEYKNADGNQIRIEGKGLIWYGDWPGGTDLQLNAGETKEFPVTLKVPTDSPTSSSDLKYKFFVRADVDGAKDPEFFTNFDVNG